MTVNKFHRHAGTALLGAMLATLAAATWANPNLDALQWLERISQAALKLNYTGTFVYLQQGGQPQTSRITHLIEGGSERERLEMLEGAPVVVVRFNDEVRSFFPDTKTVLIEKRRSRPGFPSLGVEPLLVPSPASSPAAVTASGSFAAPAGSPAAAVQGRGGPSVPLEPASTAALSAARLAENYTVRKWDTQRIAGIECQVLLLEPKDGLRYGHKLWADMTTGLLLKAQMFNERGDVVEQIGFTQVEIGGIIEKYQARLARRDGGRDWRVAGAQVSDANFAEAGWKIDAAIPGFRKISEMKRSRSDGAEFGQVVFSDGLSSVSVFVEPARPGVKVRDGAAVHGAANVYRRSLGDHVVTVLGEAPAACVTRIARAIEFKPAAATAKRGEP